MFAARSKLLEKLQCGEDSNLELKEVRLAGGKIRSPRQLDLAEELAAFANSQGGVLLLGVQDKTREVIGIPLNRLETVEMLILQACEDSIEPSLAPIIERLTLPDYTGVERAVIRIDIRRSLFVHHSGGRYFHRVGSSKRLMSPEYFQWLFQQRSQSRLIRFDETQVSTATLDDLQEKLWRRFCSPHLSEAPQHLLSKLAMVSQDDEGLHRPTIAGILMACRNPEYFLPGAFIQAVAYQGSMISPQAEAAYQRDSTDIKGNIDSQIFKACDFVRKNMRVAGRKISAGGWEDLPQFDMLAVFEAITNAVAHRDYSMSGSKVRLRIFDDRLEIFSPGLLPNTMTPESLPYRLATRNEAITSLLARCPVEHHSLESYRTHIMDKRGEGVPLILSLSKKLSGKSPLYRLFEESELVLTIYAAKISN